MPRFDSGHVYSAVISGVSVSAAQDLFALTPVGHAITIHRIEVGQDASETSENLPIQLRRGTGATAGSGGSAVTPNRIVPGARAATTTVARNNTTAETAGAGALLVLSRRAFNVVTGYVYAPTPEEKIRVNPGETFTVHLPSNPGAALTMSCEIIFEEMA